MNSDLVENDIMDCKNINSVPDDRAKKKLLNFLDFLLHETVLTTYPVSNKVLLHIFKKINLEQGRLNVLGETPSTLSTKI